MSYQTTGPQTTTQWIVRLLRMDMRVFDEVRHDHTATSRALMVVVIASLLSGFGAWLWWTVRDFGIGHGGDVFVRAFILGGLLQAAVWTLWVYIAYQVLARVYDTDLEFAALVRTMGFAFAPMGLSVLMIITALAIPMALIALGATLLFTNQAIEATTNTSGARVTIANISGFAVFALVMGIIANIGQFTTIGGLAPGIFFFNLD